MSVGTLGIMIYAVEKLHFVIVIKSQHTPYLQFALYPLEFPLSDRQAVVVSRQLFRLCPFSLVFVFASLLLPPPSSLVSLSLSSNFFQVKGAGGGGREESTDRAKPKNTHAHTHKEGEPSETQGGSVPLAWQGGSVSSSFLYKIEFHKQTAPGTAPGQADMIRECCVSALPH